MSVAFDFLNRFFIVTGAGKGIGRDVVLSLLHNNARVLAVSRTRTDLEDLVGAGGASSLDENKAGRLSHLAVDVSDHAVFETALKDALELEEEVHGLVNCAGIARLDSLLEMSSESFDTHIDTNLGGPFVATKVVGNAMKDRGIKGSIVNMSSQASSIALPRHTGYCCSKAGLDMLTKMTALELGPYGIRCNSVCPTVVMTPMGLRVWGVEDKAKPMRDRIPLGRFAEMSEVTSAVLYLLSDASSMTTGSSISVDGGFTTTCTLSG
ncbi:L-xylulose reductase, putative [Perkinsus marinus ATCC 50983]|uniref:L-xylulose reductase, putative n=1 Tax=Perkinsus marinus (strain ATCC 50983 / TXsc) TaxID=423536 RepID=C5LHS3_PERM5|nr:L-xylulose reductase, putative [Perkinsus marinus ATCC 50983]EER03677.1 L-xylulose reductase, putative [Perkinsus marinus ATCC 50983]|eukprot:XP_002771861.1 L-xylulose reductase, putative [Perkinsus marinus ATCC 50983]